MFTRKSTNTGLCPKNVEKRAHPTVQKLCKREGLSRQNNYTTQISGIAISKAFYALHLFEIWLQLIFPRKTTFPSVLCNNNVSKKIKTHIRLATNVIFWHDFSIPVYPCCARVWSISWIFLAHCFFEMGYFTDHHSIFLLLQIDCLVLCLGV